MSKKRKLSRKEFIIVASMLFGMFFGAGNLIFPVSMGQMAGSKTALAALGFCVTGVGLPLAGIAAMGISESDGLFDMSCKVGKGFAYFFTCALYLTIGPLFAIPRTATVSFQIGIAPFVVTENLRLALMLFSAVFFAVVLCFALRPSGILVWIGKVLNPLFLLFLGVLILISVVNPMGSVSAAVPADVYASSAFMTGFLEGYNTMDALASLAFGIILIDVIRDLGIKDSGDVSACTVKSGILAIFLMALIYCSLAYMGACSASLLGVSSDGGTALYTIACHYFGPAGGIFLGIMITFACLKTSIGLVTSCATTFAKMFPKMFSYKVLAIGFSLFSFGIANVGLNRIIRMSIPVLSFLYPITIVLIVLCFVAKRWGYKKRMFSWGIGFTILTSCMEILASIPFEVRCSIPVTETLCSVYRVLPLAGEGMGWIVPALAGCVIGTLLEKKIGPETDRENL